MYRNRDSASLIVVGLSAAAPQTLPAGSEVKILRTSYVVHIQVSTLLYCA